MPATLNSAITGTAPASAALASQAIVPAPCIWWSPESDTTPLTWRRASSHIR